MYIYINTYKHTFIKLRFRFRAYGLNSIFTTWGHGVGKKLHGFADRTVTELGHAVLQVDRCPSFGF